MRVVNTVELKNRTNEVLRDVVAGEPAIVTLHGKCRRWTAGAAGVSRPLAFHLFVHPPRRRVHCLQRPGRDVCGSCRRRCRICARLPPPFCGRGDPRAAPGAEAAGALARFLRGFQIVPRSRGSLAGRSVPAPCARAAATHPAGGSANLPRHRARDRTAGGDARRRDRVRTESGSAHRPVPSRRPQRRHTGRVLASRRYRPQAAVARARRGCPQPVARLIDAVLCELMFAYVTI